MNSIFSIKNHLEIEIYYSTQQDICISNQNMGICLK